MAVSTVQIVGATGALLLVAGVALYVIQSPSSSRVPIGPVAKSPERPAQRPVESAIERPAPDTTDQTLRQILDDLNPSALNDAPPGVLLAKSESSDGRMGSITMNGKFMGRGVTAGELLAVAFGTSRSRLRLSAGVRLPDGRFDYLISLPTGQKEALQQAIRAKLGLTAHPGTQEVEVFVLTARDGEFQNRRPSDDNSGRIRVRQESGSLNLENASIAAFVRNLESMVALPVVDESGLRGRFDILLTFDPGDGPGGTRQKPSVETVRKAASEQLGLDLQREKRELDVMLVESGAQVN